MLRRHFSAILLVSVSFFLFSGCSKSVSSSAAVTEYMRNVNTADIRAAITASFPSHVSEYTVDYTYEKDGNEKISVIKPESISDISVTVKDGSCELIFDGMHLETGQLDESGLSPLSALPCLMNAWRGGNIAESANSSHDGDDCLLIISRHTADGVALEYRTWFEIETIKPLYAEIYSGGVRVIQCEFERTDYK